MSFVTSGRSKAGLRSWSVNQLIQPPMNVRQRRESEIRGDIVGLIPFLLRSPGRFATSDRGVELGAPPWLRIFDRRRTQGGRYSGIGLAVDRAADRSGQAVLGRVLRFARVLHPLGLARLAGDHRDRIRGRGRVFGRENVVEDGEPACIAPEERNGIAIDM